MMIETDRIKVVVLADALLSITLKQAQDAIKAVLAYNGDAQLLDRLTLTGQESTTTQWLHLLPFLDWVMAIGQDHGLRIFGNLVGVTQELVRAIAERKVKMYGEWFGPSLDKKSVIAMVQQGTNQRDAELMLEGIKIAHREGALTGLEFQINRQNIGHIEPFLRLCQKLGIEGHLEMQETPFVEPRDVQLASRYRANRPATDQFREVAALVAKLTGDVVENLVPPFLCPGGCDGACNYFRRGVFLWPNGQGGLQQTVCLSDKTIVDSDWQPNLERIGSNQRRLREWRFIPQARMEGKCQICDVWQSCLGGCRAMAYLASGSRFAPDPNCWK